MDTGSLAARDIASHLHPFTNPLALERVPPLVIARGRGVRVYDEDGRDYIEGLAGLWCAALGFGEERLAEAAAAQIRTLSFYHGFGGKSHEPVIRLAETLLRLSPVPMSKVFFANSGSEANDTAVKLVRYYNNALGRPAKKKIIARDKAYHGVTVMTASLTGLPNNQRGFDVPLPGVLHTLCPHHYRFGRPGESEEAFAARCADELEALILAEGPDTVAAFFAEPVMGAGGVLIPPATYFARIQDVLRRYDVLLVADEVITGFGRTGHLFGCQTYDIRPDMITVAKALSSGTLPISALLVSEPIYGAVRRQSGEIGIFGHGYTYSGHPVAAAVALETLRIYEERDVVGHVRTVAPHFHDHLHAFASHPLVGEVRSVGLIGAIELVRDKATGEPFPASEGVGPMAVAHAQRHGLILRAMGDSVAFAPPLIVTTGELDELFARFTRALEDTTRALGS